ncbi:hypothetical protein C8A05DRAFT_30280 [Staphylotrichum tortipilum]|uniref:Uncharacterized protein n=1 Tax=Staphylotrichum tortipilum TaxID=2831512 RepID=A0AAN6MT14_9PEZI|nr:hypothetical protein C8A05DRAFT_30280 [Staphylotrichum longicolle]
MGGGSAHHSGAAASAHKLTKARGKMVKPILKKLSHSEKNSLDLDRGWEEQQVEQLEVDGWDGAGAYGGSYGGGYGGGGYAGYAGQARDIGFGFASAGGIAAGVGAGDVMMMAGGAGGVGGSMGSMRATPKFQHGGHGRSGSQTSAGSGPRGGAFVHPFAQTPRTSTPPLSYANSLASFDNGRDCSPTITEGEDDDGFETGTTATAATIGATSATTGTSTPSLNSQRTASFPEPSASNPPSLRITTTARSISGATTSSSRLAQGSLLSGSHSDLHLNAHASHPLSVSVTDTLDSPTGSLGACSIINSHSQQSQQQSQQQQQHQSSSSSSQLSPLRTSLDMGAGFRLRSRSELDTATRAENIRVARRKFDEREKEKEEKYDREMIRKRERRDNKEALRIEKGDSHGSGRGSISMMHPHRKKTTTGLSTVSEPGNMHNNHPAATNGNNSPGPGRLSLGDHIREHINFSVPSGGGSSSNSPILGLGRRRHTTDSPSATDNNAEKRQMDLDFAARRYDAVSLNTPPAFGVSVDDVRFEQTRPRRRSSGAKRRTQGYWQGFLLWLRTKLLRMGGR